MTSDNEVLEEVEESEDVFPDIDKPDIDVHDLFAKVVEMETQIEDLYERVEIVKDGMVRSANSIAKLFADFKKMYFEHVLTPDAHNSALVWRKRQDLEKKKKEAERERDQQES